MPISRPLFCDLLMQVLAIEDSAAFTEFELLTAVGFVYFSQATALDFVIIETGLGGLLDATNVITPMVSIITSIGLDHMDILGNTLSDIATQKAGIIKPRIPVISTSLQAPCVKDVLNKVAASLDSPLHWIEPLKTIPDTFIMNNPYQRVNVSLAQAALPWITPKNPQLAQAGFATARHPGRFDKRCLNGHTLIIDGAHNADGFNALLNDVSTQFPQVPIHFILGFYGTKDAKAMMGHLHHFATHTPMRVHLCDFDPHDSWSLPAVTSVSTICINSIELDDIKPFIERQEPRHCVYVLTGSLYFIAKLIDCL